jgi:hypothetical protein
MKIEIESDKELDSCWIEYEGVAYRFESFLNVLSGKCEIIIRKY